MESRYLSSLFKDISEGDLIYYAEERQRALSTRDLEKKYLLQLDTDSRKNLKRIHRLQSLI
jgi:hypothetical protein